MRAGRWAAFFFIPLLVAGATILLALTGAFSWLSGRADDFFLLLKPSPQPPSEILLVDIDERAASLAGAWPWTRDTLADGLVTMKEMGAASAVLDLPLAQQSPPSLDPSVLRQTLPDALDREFAQMEANIQSLFDAIRRGSVRPKDSARYVSDLVGLVALAKVRLRDATMGIARDDDALLGQAVSFFGDAYAPVDFLPAADPQVDADLARLAAQRMSLPLVITGRDPFHSLPGIRPSVLPATRAAKGGGFTAIAPDVGGVYRSAAPMVVHEGDHFGHIALSALLDTLGNPTIEATEGGIVLRGAARNGVPVPTIVLPLDDRGRLLLGWPRSFTTDGFRHLSWADLIRYRRLEGELVSLLHGMDGHGYLSYLRSPTGLLDAYEEAARLERDMLAAGGGDSLSNWRQTRDLFFSLADQFLNGDAETRIVEDADRALSAPGVTAEEKQGITTERDSVGGSFDDARRVLSDLVKVRQMLARDLPGAFCIVAVAPGADTPSTGHTPFGVPATDATAAAALVSTVLTGAFIRALPDGWVYLITALLCLIAGIATWRRKPFVSFLIALAIAVAASVACAVTFVASRVIVDPIVPSAAVVLAGAALAILQATLKRRSTRAIRATFGGRVSAEGLAELIAHPEGTADQGARRELTVLSLAEKGMHAGAATHDPADVARQLAEYNAGVGEVIRSLRGMVGGQGGDRMTAYFGAPLPSDDHVRRACLAAVRIRAVETELNIVASPRLETRVGIDTGTCMTGRLGSPGYSVVGSATDLADRLEGLTE
ncbi:MAG TPA: CHASE2 domain-containing protein, partial [Spirochaetia bacterium]